ncbi:hypothetical protein QL285_016541 [Trifolium repens]|nr:hypothetical protein QL285_016541 [Trifolium repens]
MTILPTDEPQQSDNLTEKLDGISSPQNSDNNTEILNVNQPEDEHQSHVIISEDEISNSVLPKNNTKISWILKVTPTVANKSKLQVLLIIVITMADEYGDLSSPSGMVARVSFLADMSDYALLQQHDGSKCNSLLIKVKR